MAPDSMRPQRRSPRGKEFSEDAAYDALIAKAGRNKNTQRLMHMWADPEFIAQINKDRDLWALAQGIDVAYEPCSAIRATRRVRQAA